jgi:hypothetical protein
VWNGSTRLKVRMGPPRCRMQSQRWRANLIRDAASYRGCELVRPEPPRPGRVTGPLKETAEVERAEERALLRADGDAEKAAPRRREWCGEPRGDWRGDGQSETRCCGTWGKGPPGVDALRHFASNSRLLRPFAQVQPDGGDSHVSARGVGGATSLCRSALWCRRGCSRIRRRPVWTDHLNKGLLPSRSGPQPRRFRGRLRQRADLASSRNTCGRSHGVVGPGRNGGWRRAGVSPP